MSSIFNETLNLNEILLLLMENEEILICQDNRLKHRLQNKHIQQFLFNIENNLKLEYYHHFSVNVAFSHLLLLKCCCCCGFARSPIPKALEAGALLDRILCVSCPSSFSVKVYWSLRRQ